MNSGMTSVTTQGKCDHVIESYNDPEPREMYDIQKHTHNGLDVRFIRDGVGKYYFSQDGICFKLQLLDRKTFSGDAPGFCDIAAVPLHITPGWHCFEGYDFYRDKNGKADTKPTVIDGVLYDFKKNGMCRGTYTGIVRTKNGKVYYSKCLRVKNKVLEFKSGKKFRADRNGILTEIA